jgi:hypothetical protein
VQQRGAAVIKARKQSSSLSAASAACDHMRDWILGTPKVRDLLILPSSKNTLNFPVKKWRRFALQGTWVCILMGAMVSPRASSTRSR